MRRRSPGWSSSALAVALATAAVAVAAAPAWAHEEINPPTFPTGRPTFFTVDAANEKSVDLTTITLTAPAGPPFGATTRQPVGWTGRRSDDAVTWSGGRVAPNTFEQWGFEIEGADQPGPLRYKVSLGYADGTSEDAEVEVSAVAPGAAPVATSVAPLTASGSAAAVKTETSSQGRANAALAVAVVAGVLALAALAGIAFSRKRATAPRAPGGDTTRSQDW